MNRVCTIQASAARKIINLAQRSGVSAQSLCREVRLDLALVDNPDRRIPFAQIVLLYERAAALTGDDMFGIHLGESIDPRVFDVLGYAALNSPTVGEAFLRVARYHSIWTDGAELDLETADSNSTVTYRYVDRTLGECRQDTEMTLAAFAALGRLVTIRHWSPREVRFMHDAPRATSEHTRIFRCPVRFGCELNELVFDAATLKLPITQADPALCAVLDRHAEELLAKYPRQDAIIDQVRNVIRKELRGGDPSLEAAAAHLGLSSRTLQRRLRENSTSHNELLDQMRKDLALRYMKEPQVAICEVAYLLGFSERSALHRAFKRWTGMTPSEFRQQP
jgi:AraC-like DNA-binding protein